MNKKIAIVLLFVWVCFGCCACSNTKMVDEQRAKESLTFFTVEDYDAGKVIVDNETNVMYWMSAGPYNWGTLTVLVDETGNPKIYEGR